MQVELGAFFERFVYPLVDALACGEPALYDCARRGISDSLHDPAMNPDLRRAAEYILSYYVFTSTIVLNQFDLQAPALREALAGFAVPAAGVMSSLIQRRYLLQLRVFANNAAVQELSCAEMDALAATLPPGDRHTEQWFHISEFYFRTGNLERVVEAYEQYMEGSSKWARDYNWRRLNVMVKLLDGSASRLDAELLIREMVVPGCAKEIERSFWPHFVRLGIADDELHTLLEQRLEALQHELAAQPA
jgi:hypothetical protein